MENVNDLPLQKVIELAQKALNEQTFRPGELNKLKCDIVDSEEIGIELIGEFRLNNCETEFESRIIWKQNHFISRLFQDGFLEHIHMFDGIDSSILRVLMKPDSNIPNKNLINILYGLLEIALVETTNGVLSIRKISETITRPYINLIIEKISKDL